MNDQQSDWIGLPSQVLCLIQDLYLRYLRMRRYVPGWYRELSIKLELGHHDRNYQKNRVVVIRKTEWSLMHWKSWDRLDLMIGSLA
jgi:hypothetical protein